MTETPRTPRTAADIEAELAAARLQLTNTVNELQYRLKPSTQVNIAKDKAKAFASDAADTAKMVTEEAKEGDPRAIGILAGAAVGVASLILFGVLRKKK
ncbi:Protein of unknown function [Ruaniaceae bacterium KH17]|nr:Protein of unknown function [Ruaniaceae bacterium KH17]